ncbi:DUF1800 family protein [Flavicella sediminum]|uniref:DUF1800 family protein n=1 Tax=Flavicella sediminum TaxID=2585141 RepID=UPI0011205B3D|nr:DUF1800 family protein [Flavicella sediminum]
MASLTPYSGSLGKRLAKHLLRRATYNISKSRIEEFSNYDVNQAIAKLATIPVKNLNQPIHYVNGGLTQPSPWIDDDPIYGAVNTDNDSGNSKLRNFVVAWWLDEAKRDTSYRSKMTYFLFTDFTAASSTLNGQYGAFYDYLRLLEFFSLGDWKEFIFQVTKNNIMLSYLNNNQNTNTNPNENYAREVLELFTIGKGTQAAAGDYTNYTEKDVEEAAKVLTGWTYTWNDRNKANNGVEFGNIPCGYPNIWKHDYGKKEFSHRFNNYVIDAWDTSGKSSSQKEARIEAELKEFIAMVVDMDETAKFICRKLYRYFVSRNITSEIENDIIVPLANTFRTNFNLQETIDQLLKSQHFYDADDSDNSDEIIGALIKSPLDLVLQTLSITNYPVPDPITDGKSHYQNFYYWQVVLGILGPASQEPFVPPSVAGFPPTYEAPDFDKFWFNSSTIIPRYNMADILLNASKTKTNFYVSTFIEENVSNPNNPTLLVTELTDLLFPEAISSDRLNYLVHDILLEDGATTPQMWSDEWNIYKNSGNNAGVESVLKPLFRALTWSQEYQNI